MFPQRSPKYAPLRGKRRLRIGKYFEVKCTSNPIFGRLFSTSQQSTYIGTNAKHLCYVFLYSFRDRPCMLRYGASVGFESGSVLGSIAHPFQVQVHIHYLFSTSQQSPFMGTNAKHLCNVFLCSLRDCPCMLRYGASVGFNLGSDLGSSAQLCQVQVHIHSLFLSKNQVKM